MICLSFDTDHMNEARMMEFLELCAWPGRGTFFCTQAYAALAAREHELCPHPYLGTDSNWDTELASMRRTFPLARGWRSHSCVFSHTLAEQVAAMGYAYASTQDDLGNCGLHPHRHAWGLWQMPIYYMDNLDFSHARFWPESAHVPFSTSLIDAALEGDALYIFDFHPIHLMLNSHSAASYFERRDAFKRGDDLRALRCDEPGVHDFFRQLTERMALADVRSVSIGDALNAWIAGHWVRT